MANLRILRYDDPLALELTASLKQGDVDRLSRLLISDRGLACCVVEDEKGGGRSPLHLFADWPGHNPNPAPIVRALAADGADLDVPAVGMWHREAPLHWAASSDDVALIDALLDAGADIERPGSSINGGSPLSCAVGYGQWAAARRLVERGARTLLWHEAAVGLMKRIAQRFETEPHPGPEEISGAFWNACRGGQIAAAQWLLKCGADPKWRAPWSGQTPLDIAERSGHGDLAAWLTGNGAIRQERTPDNAGRP
jgi:ankyrin repeat protein